METVNVEDVLIEELENYDPFEITPYVAQEFRYAFNDIAEDDLPTYLRRLSDYLAMERGNATLLNLRLQHDYDEEGTQIRIEAMFSTESDRYTDAMWEMHCKVRGTNG